MGGGLSNIMLRRNVDENASQNIDKTMKKTEDQCKNALHHVFILFSFIANKTYKCEVEVPASRPH